MATGRKTGGRVKGSRNKVVRDIKLAAQRYTEDALATLADIMKNGQQEAARVSAARELMNRGWGLPAQSVELSGEISIAHVLDAARERLKHARG